MSETLSIAKRPLIPKNKREIIMMAKSIELEYILKKKS